MWKPTHPLVSYVDSTSSRKPSLILSVENIYSLLLIINMPYLFYPGYDTILLSFIPQLFWIDLNLQMKKQRLIYPNDSFKAIQLARVRTECEPRSFYLPTCPGLFFDKSWPHSLSAFPSRGRTWDQGPFPIHFCVLRTQQRCLNRSRESW